MQSKTRPVIIYTTTLHLMVLHGALEVALKHPQWTGQSAALGVDLLKMFDETLAASGLFESEELNELKAGAREAIAYSESRRT